jgi:hypothetical protein
MPARQRLAIGACRGPYTTVQSAPTGLYQFPGPVLCRASLVSRRLVRTLGSHRVVLLPVLLRARPVLRLPTSVDRSTTPRDPFSVLLVLLLLVCAGVVSLGLVPPTLVLPRASVRRWVLVFLLHLVGCSGVVQLGPVPPTLVLPPASVQSSVWVLLLLSGCTVRRVHLGLDPRSSAVLSVSAHQYPVLECHCRE